MMTCLTTKKHKVSIRPTTQSSFVIKALVWQVDIKTCIALYTLQLFCSESFLGRENTIEALFQDFRKTTVEHRSQSCCAGFDIFHSVRLFQTKSEGIASTDSYTSSNCLKESTTVIFKR